MDQHEMIDQEIDLRELIFIIIEKWWILAIFIVIGVLITAFVTMNLITPMYESRATLFIGKDGSSIGGLDLSIGDIQFDRNLVSDYRELIKTRLVTTEVINSLGLNLTVTELRNNLDISIISDSRFMHVVYKDPNPQMATTIANRLSEELIDKAVDIVGVQNVRIVDYAIPGKNPVSPRTTLNLAISFVLSAMIGLFSVFLINMLDNTIKKEEDVERIGLSVIGIVPKFEGDDRDDGRGSWWSNIFKRT